MTGSLTRRSGDRPPGVLIEASGPRGGPAPLSFWRLIARNRLLIAGCALLLVVSTVLASFWITPRFEASASIRIDPNDAPLIDLGGSRAERTSEIPTEFQVLQSRRLLELVTDSLGLQLELRRPGRLRRAELFAPIRSSRVAEHGEYRLERQSDGRVLVLDRSTGDSVGSAEPGAVLGLRGLRAWVAPRHALDRAFEGRSGGVDFDVYSFDETIKRLQGALQIRRRPEANILDVTYQGTDPVLVQAVPNVLAARFIADRQREHRAEAHSTAIFLREQIAKLSGRLRGAEENLRTFRERAGVVSLPDEASTGLMQAGELQAKRNALEAERVALAGLVIRIRDSVGPDSSSGLLAYRSLVAFPTLLQNEAMSQPLASLAQIEDRRSELLSRRSLRDPDVQVLTARANQLGSQLQGLALTYLQGLTNQVAALDAVLSQSREQLARIPRKELQFSRLQREAKGLEDIVTQLQTRLKEAEIAEAVEDPSVRLVDDAVLPQTPSSPKPLLNAAIAVVFGLGLGIAGAFLREYVDQTARTREDVTVATGVSVIGLLPRAHGRIRRTHPQPPLAAPRRAGAAGRASYSLFPESPLPDEEVSPQPAPSDTSPAGVGRASAPARAAARRPRRSTPALLIGPEDDFFPSREGYNQLATNLAFAQPGKPRQVLVVTSPLPREGKSTVAMNLAVTMALSAPRVLLIDGDLRRGVIAAALGVHPEPGLTEILSGTVPPFETIQVLPVSEREFLHVIPAGRAGHNPPALLGPELATLLGTLRAEYDTIIVDTPPVNVVADAKLVAAHSDGVIVVARAGVTSMQALAFANEELRHVGAPVLGAVLNSIDFRRDASYDEAYQYYASGALYVKSSS